MLRPTKPDEPAQMYPWQGVISLVPVSLNASTWGHHEYVDQKQLEKYKRVLAHEHRYINVETSSMTKRISFGKGRDMASNSR
ncbi:hypothetical protein AVEN_214894-1 [Araneus ventricosus]|uniref:Uncharacterized protein n=1 Tax=Araneus ventricosus TaxID=182803 RepID=A0A4Y2KWV4_ARAVE|nr:hypothetical protein AVEN_214894-1 [Araneus ventricosus]